MKAKLLFIIIGVLTFASCVKEKVSTDQEFSFIKFSGQSSSTIGQDVKQLSDGSYVAFGTTSTTNGNGRDMYLAKFDKYGNEIWHKTYGGRNDQTGNSFQVLSDGSFILAGSTFNNDLKSSIYLVKTNANGDTSNNSGWTKTISDTTSLFANNLQISSTGGFIIAGSYISSKIKNALLVFTDNEGNNAFSCRRDPPSTSANEIKYVTEVKTGGYVIIGISGTSEILLQYVDSNKTNVWEPNEYPIYGDSGVSVKQLADGNFICTGDSAGYILVMKFKHDETGFSPIWSKKYRGDYNYLSNDIEVVSDNEYAITGYQGNKSNTKNMLFLTIDGIGNNANHQVYGVTGNQVGQKIISTKGGGFLIVGTNSTLGVNEMTLIKTKKDGGL